jgi:hypothetical protein
VPAFDSGPAYVDGQTATAEVFNDKWDLLEEFLNVTKLDDDNLQLSAIVAAIVADLTLLRQLGVPVFASNATAVGSVSVTSYAALSPNVTLTIPLDGNYIISHGFQATNNSGIGVPVAFQSYSVGAAAPVGGQDEASIRGSGGTASMEERKTGLTAGNVLTLKNMVSVGANWSFSRRWIKAVKVP